MDDIRRSSVSNPSDICSHQLSYQLDQLLSAEVLQRTRRRGDAVFLQGPAEIRFLQFREPRDPVIAAQLFQPGHGLLLEAAFTEQCPWIDSGLE